MKRLEEDEKIASKAGRDFVQKEIKRTIYPENGYHYID